MRVDGLIFADDHLIAQIRNDQAPEQVANVPPRCSGIQKASLAMPDIHWGYGFPDRRRRRDRSGAGGRHLPGRRRLRHQLRRPVAAVQISPGTIVKLAFNRLVDQLFRDIPTGVGQSGNYKFDKPKLKRLMEVGL